MRDPHCPSCGTPYVRPAYDEGVIGRLLSTINVSPFRCQLCTNRFRTFGARPSPAEITSDRREYKRLPSSFHADFLDRQTLRTHNRVTDISMGGCTLETASMLPQGTFLELMIQPISEEAVITVETAMVCSVRSDSLGVRFLEFRPEDKRRLSRVVLSLLVGQGIRPSLTS